MSEEEAMGSRRPSIPTTLDAKKLAAMRGPFEVRLTRQHEGGPPEVIPLTQGGKGWTEAMVRAIEQSLSAHSGGGNYHCQVLSESTGETLEWRFFLPGQAVVPAEAQIGAAAAQQRAVQALAQAQGAGTEQRVNPFAQPAPAPPAPPWPPQPAAPTAPAWVSPPQGSGQQPSPWQPPGWGPAPASPWQPWQPPGWGPAPASPWQPPMPWGVGQPIPLGAAGLGLGVPPQVEQKLAALEQQNQILREEAIRRQNSEAVSSLTAKYDQLLAESTRRFEQMIEKIGSLQHGHGGDSELRGLIERMEADRRLENQRQEAQRVQEQLRAEAARKEEMAALQRQIDLQAQQAREREERIARELADARARSEQSSTMALMQHLTATQAKAQEQTALAQQQTMAMVAPHLLTPEKLITVIKEANPNKDTVTEKLANAALQMMMDGGGGGWPQAATQIAGALMDSAGKITSALFEAKGREAQAKMLADAQAQRTMAAIAQRGQPKAQQQLAGTSAGAGTSASQPPEASGPTTTPVAAAAQEQVATDDSLTAQQLLEQEERRYFGAVYEPVLKMRVAFEQGAFPNAEAVAEAITGAYQYFAIGMGMEPPVIKDIDAGELEKVIRAVLPDAPGPLRHDVVRLLGPKIEAVEQQAEQWQNQNQSATNGSPASEAVAS